MATVLGIVGSPLFLGMVMFFGMASLMRLLLARDPSLKRGHRADRRRRVMPAIPFLDSDGVQVTGNRRRLTDRRRSRVAVMQAETQRDRTTG